jgi:hypothetical protein
VSPFQGWKLLPVFGTCRKCGTGDLVAAISLADDGVLLSCAECRSLFATPLAKESEPKRLVRLATPPEAAAIGWPVVGYKPVRA